MLESNIPPDSPAHIKVNTYLRCERCNFYYERDDHLDGALIG